MLLCCFTLVAVYYSYGQNNLVDTTSGYFSKPQVRYGRSARVGPGRCGLYGQYGRTDT